MVFQAVLQLVGLAFILNYAHVVTLPFYDVSARIVNGEDAAKGEFPWMAMITDGMGNQFCGGALLNSRFILTAAHCMLGDPLVNPPNVLVRLGALLQNAEEEGSTSHYVRRITKHPNYIDEGMISDIALLELQDHINFTTTTTIRPINLPDAYFNFVDKTATVAGWGLLHSNGRGSEILQKAEVPVLSDEACKHAYEAMQVISKDMMCAGGNGKDSCSKDSGGPLMWKGSSGDWFIIGVVSWGLHCGESPGVYSSVQYALPWIRNTIA